MPAQPDLFPRTAFEITPAEGRRAPKLWIRRLAIFRNSSSLIRDVQLRPGLNIIWSPDAGDASGQPIGHGGGKTMFCRLIRYCLGEDGFAPTGQRRRISDAIPEGIVAAEVMLDGECWAVARSLSGRSEDRVVRNAERLEDALGIDPDAQQIEVMKGALAHSILGDCIQLMPDPIRRRPWQAALAWATRDQECRFGHPLEWRDPNSDSHSPVRGRSKEDILATLRALLNALSEGEIAARQAEEEVAAELARVKNELSRLEWQIGRQSKAIGAKLGLGDAVLMSGLDLAEMKSRAADEQAAALALPMGSKVDLDASRGEVRSNRDKLQNLQLELRDLETRIEEGDKYARLVEGELPDAYGSLVRAGNPICPVCKVPINAVLATGCGISLEQCDLDELNGKIGKLRTELDRQRSEVADLRARVAPLKAQLARSEQALKRSEEFLSRIEASLYDRTRAVRDADALVVAVDQLERLAMERDASSARAGHLEDRLLEARKTAAEERSANVRQISYLSEMFNGVLRELVPGDVGGRLFIDGNGLTLRVELGGDRSTAAIDSWKVVAFDLAALAMGLEGRAQSSPLLVHDSPREADLGISLYTRLFNFAKSLEGYGPMPLFQYIVTTTTEPPADLCTDPWLRLKLKGAPASDRLLGIDL